MKGVGVSLAIQGFTNLTKMTHGGTGWLGYNTVQNGGDGQDRTGQEG